MGWTDERVEMLRKLWTDGLSASQIADRLGGVSRNAVIGKVHRLKLESRAKAPGSTVQAQERPAQTRSDERVETVEVVVPSRMPSPQPAVSSTPRPMPMTMGATALKMEPEEETLIEEMPERAQQTAEVVPIARKLTLVQLTENTCKWPVGDPLKPDFHFCGNGAKDASPYCAYHAKLAFQPASERRRIR